MDVLNDNLNAMTDSGAIKGLDAREDGVYITYVSSDGADPVVKKLGSGDVSFSVEVKVKLYTNSRPSDRIAGWLTYTANCKITNDGSISITNINNSSAFTFPSATSYHAVISSVSIFNVTYL